MARNNRIAGLLGACSAGTSSEARVSAADGPTRIHGLLRSSPRSYAVQPERPSPPDRASAVPEHVYEVSSSNRPKLHAMQHLTYRQSIASMESTHRRQGCS